VTAFAFVPVLRATALIDAPQRTVAGLLRDAALTAYTLGRLGHRVRAPARCVGVDDVIEFRVRLGPGVFVPITTRISRADLGGMSSSLVAGLPRRLEHTTTMVGTLAGTLVTEEIRWTSPFGVLGGVVDVVLLRRVVLALLTARCLDLTRRAEQLVDPARVVVGAALVRDGRLLVAQRSRPPALAGRWELPGGQVADGESEPVALAREIDEELGAAVRVGHRVGPDLPVDGDRLLRVYAAELDGPAEPRPLEHAALRWVGPHELDGLDWLPVDRALLPDLHALLAHDHRS
jgi:8-oxo-dGTP diphosphatase